MRTSPYSDAYILDYKDGDISLERHIPVFNNTSSTTVHTVIEGETLQSIAFRYYGDSGKWSKIADINGIFFPPRDLEVGSNIIIP